jgi:uncharacterized protein HemX
LLHGGDQYPHETNQPDEPHHIRGLAQTPFWSDDGNNTVMLSLLFKAFAAGLVACLLLPAVHAHQGSNASAREARKMGEQLQKEAKKRAKRAQREAQQRQAQIAKDIKRQHKERTREIKRKTKERERQGREIEGQVQQSQPVAPPKRKARPPADEPVDPLDRLRDYGGKTELN